ncbi:L-type lectin-domain containing receptor kinase IV.1-like [Ziziphus jujuba]|uniref:non-specific serine/threonine protein kinase n=1 Tax=Ziziphus jujuba TaxID=326968 RepID=A0ABM4ABL8_ZIZJJ|nr:L-type lectin-domain containing receptor kinase IV.1-like [Ziziphus jujuba]
MISKLVLLFFFLASIITAEDDLSFIYNGFRSANLSLDGIAEFTPNGLLSITDGTEQQQGHAFYPNPVTFKKDSLNGTAPFSFYTTFIFAIRSHFLSPMGHGFAFVIAPTRGLPGALDSQYLGLFNETSDGNETNHVIAVEFDTIMNSEFDDINENHVGIDINGLRSVKYCTAGYYTDPNGEFKKRLKLTSGHPMQVWVEYDSEKKQMDVTLAPIHVGKPPNPLLSLNRDLSPIFKNTMYVGFSSATGLNQSATHYVLGWSFKINGKAQELVVSNLPKLPAITWKGRYILLAAGLLLFSVYIISVAISGVLVIIRKIKFAELIEDWEVDYRPQRYKYKDLYIATSGFRVQNLLGSGGFGRVYRGILPNSNTEIAVKRVSHGSRQGMKEFVAEIFTMRRLRHRNLVALLGYCRRKGELLLVYDYMPNGSLDKYIYDQPKITLNWTKRFQVIKGVASAMFYLHEEWEQVVIHRDVKASNVMLDAEFNGRLGDFGLARLYDHGTEPQTTHIAGTFGYLAPEHTRTGKATTASDVFAFGAFLLEVSCGRRPIDSRKQTEDIILVDRVFSCWNRGDILEAMDPNLLGTEFVAEEVELVMKLGLLCSRSDPAARPSMRQVVKYLERDLEVANSEFLGLRSSGLAFARHEGFDDVVDDTFHHTSSVAESLLSGGR